MTTAMQDTSLLAYESIKPALGKRQQQVYNMLMGKGTALTNCEIAECLNWPINCVTPRVNELVKAGIVEEKGRKRDAGSGRAAIIWGIRGNRQMEMF